MSNMLYYFIRLRNSQIMNQNARTHSRMPLDHVEQENQAIRADRLPLIAESQVEKSSHSIGIGHHHATSVSSGLLQPAVLGK
jgi:hypothetical protein